MNDANPVDAYRRVTVTTASQGKLIVMLYDEALKQIDIAVAKMQEGAAQFDIVSNAIVKAQSIMTELMVALDRQQGSTLAEQLFGLYSFFCKRLMDANIGKNREPIDQIRPLIQDLRDAWEQIANRQPEAGQLAQMPGLDLSG